MWFILALLGGTIALVSVGKDQEPKGPEPKGPRFDNILPRVDGITKAISTKAISPVSVIEKFEDPLYLVYGSGVYTIANDRPGGLASILNRNHHAYFRSEGMDDLQRDVIIGYEYLAAVPPKAEQRVALMREKIAKKPAPSKDFGDANRGLFWAMYKSSVTSLGKLAESLTSVYQLVSTNESRANQIASALGVNTSTLKAEAKSALSASMSSVTSSGDYAVLDKAIKDYGPIARTVVNAISEAIQVGSDSALDSSDKIVKGINIAADIAVMVPVYGWIAAAALRTISGALGTIINENHKACAEDIDVIRRHIEATMSRAMVIPWHAYEVFPVTCSDPLLKRYRTDAGVSSLQMLFMKNDLYTSYEVMPAAYRTSLKRWWATAQTFISHPDVKSVFYALGIDASGGIVASDEQVMLVAAPIAAAYGFNVDELAIALYKKSLGWRGAESALREPFDANTIPGCSGKPAYCTFPHNAWWVQWAVLAADAFAIVENWQKTRVATFKIGKLGSLKT